MTHVVAWSTMRRKRRRMWSLVRASFAIALVVVSNFTFNMPTRGVKAQGGSATIPSGPLKFGMFVGRFDAGGTFSIEGKDWPPLKGSWRASDSLIELVAAEKTSDC